MEMMMEEYIEWDGCIRRDEDGDDVGPLVRVYFSAGGFVPPVKATWYQPAEGGMFEDVRFIRAEIDLASLPTTLLTDAEIASARAWFDTDEAQGAVQSVALAAMDD